MEKKICTECKNYKALNEFYTSRRGGKCKECTRGRCRFYNLSNKKKISERKKKYYEKNREIILEKGRKNYKKLSS